MKRYGLDDRACGARSAIGERLGAEREKVRQSTVEALRLLRQTVEGAGIPADVAILDSFNRDRGI